MVPLHDGLTAFHVVEDGAAGDSAYVEGDWSCDDVAAAAGDWVVLALEQPLAGATTAVVADRPPSVGETVVILGFLRTTDGVRCVEVPAEVVKNPCEEGAGTWFVLETKVRLHSLGSFNGLSGGIVARRDSEGALSALGILRGTFGVEGSVGGIAIRPPTLDARLAASR